MLDFSQLQKLTNYQDKKHFIETELNARLRQYNGSLEIFEPADVKYWNASKEELAKFVDLYTAFVDKYNHLISVSMDAKGFLSDDFTLNMRLC